MKTSYNFNGELRQTAGTGSARALRNVGKIPAVIYGSGSEPVHFSLIEKDVKREYHRGGFFGKVVSVTLDGKEINCIAKDLQVHPVNESILHADFIRVEAGSNVKALVPVRFINRDRCIGIRRGGTLNVVRFDVELVCAPDNIPEKIEIDLLSVNIGDSIHISHIKLPDGVKSSIDRDFTIAAIAGRASKNSDAEEASTAA